MRDLIVSVGGRLGNIATINDAGVVTETKAVKDRERLRITVCPNSDPWCTMLTASKIATPPRR